MTDTTIDGSIGLSDRAVHDDSALKELLTLLAPDATVRIGPGSVRGCAANAGSIAPTSPASPAPGITGTQRCSKTGRCGPSGRLRPAWRTANSWQWPGWSTRNSTATASSPTSVVSSPVFPAKTSLPLVS